MSPRDQFTHEEAVLLAKALAKAQEEISRLEDMLEDANATRDQYRDYWLEDSEKVKQLEERVKHLTESNEVLEYNLELHENAKDLPSAE